MTKKLLYTTDVSMSSTGMKASTINNDLQSPLPIDYGMNSAYIGRMVKKLIL